MRALILFMLVVAFATIGCQGPTPKKAESTELAFNRAAQIEERLLQVDSVVVVYYDDPYGSDSLRYTRFYTQVALTDSFVTDILPAQLQTVYTKMEKRNACRGEGKIWCYKEGKIMQTLYFSNNSSAQCSYLYFIKDGFFYYTTPQQSFTDALLAARKNARKPEASQPSDDTDQ